MANSKGRKNKPALEYLEGGLIRNQHNVVFTEEDKKRLESAVNSATRKRRMMLEAEAKLTREVGGVPSKDTLANLQGLGKESDFIIQPKTKSLQRFHSREDYERYMGYLERVNKRDYVKERVELYKENYATAIRNAFNDEGEDIIEKIEQMGTKEYMELVQKNEDLEIGYIYDDIDKQNKLDHIRNIIERYESQKKKK